MYTSIITTISMLTMLALIAISPLRCAELKNDTADVTSETCGAHGVPMEHCFICNKSARDAGRLWCSEHSRYEDRCFLCHPDIKDETRPFCAEHFLYEDECTICAPHSGKKQAPVQTPAETCGAHGVPMEHCFICNKSARDAGRLWCSEHSRYEDRCFLCHPDMKDEKRPFCAEHFLYEDECTICAPQEPHAHGTDDTPSAPSLRSRLLCAEHDVFEHECAVCHPELASGLPIGGELKIRFNSLTAARKAGVTLGKPMPLEIAAGVQVYSEVSYDYNHVARVTPLADGVVRRVLVDVGEYVHAGTVLVEIASTELASAQVQLLHAQVDQRLATQEYERQVRLHTDNISAERELEQAAAVMERAQMSAAAARQVLVDLGMTADDIANVIDNKDTAARLRIRAPFSGTVIERTLVLGQAVARGDTLLELADLTQMWLELSVPESALPTLILGQTVRAQFSALPGISVEGPLTWISSSVDKRTRLLRARAVVRNPQQTLKAGLYGNARIIVAEADRTGLGVPRSAIQYFDTAACIFIREADDLYVMRRVTLGPHTGTHVLIREGVQATDDVVVGNSHIVYSEMLKSKLGAGCVDD